MPTYSNQFGRPHYYDHEIWAVNGRKIGTVRVKPIGILWKPANQRSFYSVSLAKFAEWIVDPNTGAQRTKS